MMIWYDGKNQWAFMPSSNEVNLSIPSRDEIQEVNPYMILKSYKKEFKSLYKGKSNGWERVELTPLQKDGDIKNILLEIDVTRLYPVSIVIFNSNKTSLNIHVTEYQTGLNFKNSEFVFDKSGELYVKVKTYKRADGSKTYPKTESIMTREEPMESIPAAEQGSSNEGDSSYDESSDDVYGIPYGDEETYYAE